MHPLLFAQAADDSGPNLLVNAVAFFLLCLLIAAAVFAVRWIARRRGRP